MKSTLAIVLLATLLAGCGPRTPAGPPLVPGGPPPLGVIAGGVPLTPAHTLSPNDGIEIRFPFDPHFNQHATIGADGYVSPRMIKPVLLGGLTVPQATARLRQAYTGTLRAPVLSITIRSYAPEAVYVDGWVAHPGLIRSAVPLTLERAIARAGGARTGAKTGDILLIRRDAEGKLHTVQAALGDYAGAGGQDPLLKSFDIVYVPKTEIAAVSDFIGRYTKNLPFSASYSIIKQSPAITNQTLTPPATTGR
ncbi:MAG: polysaccharide biosynthesis/export family protein [Stellaceae bacterium]